MRIEIEFKKDPMRTYEVSEEAFIAMNRDYRRNDGLYHYDLLPHGTCSVDWTSVTSLREVADIEPRVIQRRVARPSQEYM